MDCCVSVHLQVLIKHHLRGWWLRPAPAQHRLERRDGREGAAQQSTFSVARYRSGPQGCFAVFPICFSMTWEVLQLVFPQHVREGVRFSICQVNREPIPPAHMPPTPDKTCIVFSHFKNYWYPGSSSVGEKKL